jgi:hypothetical protein
VEEGEEGLLLPLQPVVLLPLKRRSLPKKRKKKRSQMRIWALVSSIRLDGRQWRSGWV